MDELKLPPWEERQPLLLNGFFYLPPNYTGYENFSYSLPSFFLLDQPIHLEYCSGNGSWIIEKAKAFPHINWVAIEKRFDRAKKIWCKKQNRQLENLFVIYGEGYSFTRFYIPEKSLDAVYVNFPDPWPKRRHAKNRIFQKTFIQELARVMKKSAKISIVTDDPLYQEEILKLFLQNSFVSSFPNYVEPPQDYGSSFFNELWKKKGMAIRYMEFIR